MADGYRDMVHAAFESSEWETSADSIFHATGTSVSVLDFADGCILATTGRCSFCHLATGSGSPGPETCFDVPPGPEAQAGRYTCRAGLSTEIRPVAFEGATVAHVMTAGYVTSTRERKRLYELLLVRGVREESARLALKALPIVSRRAVDAWADVAVASASAALAAERGRRIGAERTEDVSAVLAAGRRVLAATAGERSALGGLLADVSGIVEATSAALVLPTRDGRLEVAAVHGDGPDRTGVAVSREGSLAGRAFTSRRSVLSNGEQGRASRATVALPVSVGERVLGVIELDVPSQRLPLPSADAVRLERFLRFFAATLDRMAERERSERASATATRLNEFAADVGGKTDTDAIARITSAMLADTMHFDVAGVVFEAWGIERADLQLESDTSPDDVSRLIAEAVGRNATELVADSLVVRGPGSIDPSREARADWATLAVELPGDDLTLGALFVAACDGTRFGAEDRQLLQGIAAHAGAALQRAALFARVRDDYAKTIAALAASLETHHRPATAQGGRTMSFALLIGEEMGLAREDVDALRFAALVHEIGVAGLPHEILVRPSRHTADEIRELGAHSQIGASISQQIEFLKSITPVILHHHESWDGSGYPAGLAGDAIPLLARVLAVADTFGELTAPSPDRMRMTYWEARGEVEAASGTRFDPSVVEALGRALDRQGRAGITGLVSRPSAETVDSQLPA